MKIEDVPEHIRTILKTLDRTATDEEIAAMRAYIREHQQLVCIREVGMWVKLNVAAINDWNKRNP